MNPKQQSHFYYKKYPSTKLTARQSFHFYTNPPLCIYSIHIEISTFYIQNITIFCPTIKLTKSHFDARI